MPAVSLRIGLVSPLNQLTPPRTYGGVERVVAIHAAELVRFGHRVLLFAAEGSGLPGVRALPYGSAGIWASRRHLLRLAGAVLRNDRLDVVHSFGRSNALLPFAALSGCQLVQTYACPLNAATITRLDRLLPHRISYTVPSRWMQGAFPATTSPVSVVPNSLPEDLYTLVKQRSADAPLAFLGRFDPVKGVHTAIEVALAAGVPLEIGGGSFDEPSRAYEEQLRSRWQGHPLIRFLGPLDDAGKQDLLGRARGLLFPIAWDEPFGLVMIEAMACGTPVLAFRRGSVPEVVIEGVNGYVVDDPAAMAAAVPALARLDRRAVHRSVHDRFAAAAVTTAYLRHYGQVLDR